MIPIPKFRLGTIFLIFFCYAIGLAELYEGNYELSLDHLEQAQKLIGERHAPYLLGKIHTNTAGDREPPARSQCYRTAADVPSLA